MVKCLLRILCDCQKRLLWGHIWYLIYFLITPKPSPGCPPAPGEMSVAMERATTSKGLKSISDLRRVNFEFLYLLKCIQILEGFFPNNCRLDLTALLTHAIYLYNVSLLSCGAKIWLYAHAFRWDQEKPVHFSISM